MSVEKDDQTADCRFPLVARRRDYFFCAAFLVLWILPISYVGLTDRWVPLLPRFFNDMYRIAKLFPKRINYWAEFYLQIRTAGSEEDEWENVPDSDFTTMYPFGYRSRFNLLLSHARKTGLDSEADLRWKDKLHDELALFIKNRYEKLSPDHPPVVAVRVGEVLFPVGSEIARPAGRWRKPYLVQVPIENRHSYFERSFPSGHESTKSGKIEEAERP